MTRAVENANPLNIRRGSPWRGLSPDQPDKDFCTFVEPIYGFRAAAIVLGNYRLRYGIRTIRGVIGRWAPPEDGNDTPAYVRTVCAALGVEADAEVDLGDAAFVARLMLAMTTVEAGRGHPFTTEQAEDGAELAGMRAG